MGEEDHSNEWWCEKCQMYVDGKRVTYTEHHDVCGYPVIAKDAYYFTDSGFAPVKQFMEQSLPVVWEEYLRYIAKLFAPLDYCSDGTFRMVLNKQLDLTNLIQYLLDNRGGWGKKSLSVVEIMK
jgi:hypothetical protein